MKLPKVPGMGNMGQMIQQVQNAMKQAQELEEQLASERFETTAGGGVVKAMFTGTGEIVSLEIAPEVVDPGDVETLQDSILSAVRQGHQKATEIRQARVQELTGGLPNIPGMNLPF